MPAIPSPILTTFKPVSRPWSISPHKSNYWRSKPPANYLISTAAYKPPLTAPIPWFKFFIVHGDDDDDDFNSWRPADAVGIATKYCACILINNYNMFYFLRL